MRYKKALNELEFYKETFGFEINEIPNTNKKEYEIKMYN